MVSKTEARKILAEASLTEDNLSVLKEVCKNNSILGATSTELSEKLNRSEKSIRYHLRKLKKQDLITKNYGHRICRYNPTERGESLYKGIKDEMTNL